MAGGLDREFMNEYELVVIATDSADNPESVQQVSCSLSMCAFN